MGYRRQSERAERHKSGQLCRGGSIGFNQLPLVLYVRGRESDFVHKKLWFPFYESTKSRKDAFRDIKRKLRNRGSVLREGRIISVKLAGDIADRHIRQPAASKTTLKAA